MSHRPVLNHPLIGRRIRTWQDNVEADIVGVHVSRKCCGQLLFTVETDDDRTAALFADQFELIEKGRQ